MDINSLRISEMKTMGDASVFLLVAIVDPSKVVLSEMETISTGGSGGGGLSGGRGVLVRRMRLELDFLELVDQVDAVALEVETDLAGSMGI